MRNTWTLLDQYRTRGGAGQLSLEQRGERREGEINTSQHRLARSLTLTHSQSVIFLSAGENISHQKIGKYFAREIFDLSRAQVEMVEFVQSIRLLSEMEGLIEILVPPAPPSLQGCVKLVWSVTATTHALSMTSANLPGKLGPQRQAG